MFHRLCRDYQLEGIEFNADSICVIADKYGVLLDDIKTPEETKRRRILSPKKSMNLPVMRTVFCMCLLPADVKQWAITWAMP